MESANPSRPTESAAGERQRADALAGGGEDGVGYGGQDGRQGELAEAGGQVICPIGEPLECQAARADIVNY